MEEMLDDTMNLEEDEEVEEEADEEVNKVLFELTNGKLGQAGTVDTQPPVSTLLPCEFTTEQPNPYRLLRSTRSRQRGRWKDTGNN
jgi:charged multivesicular body protein 3